MKRKFLVHFEGSAELEIDDELLKSCNTDEWRQQMLQFTRDEQFVEHIAYNMVLNNLDLIQIDGYADQPKERAKVLRVPDWEVEAEEITVPEVPW